LYTNFLSVFLFDVKFFLPDLFFLYDYIINLKYFVKYNQGETPKKTYKR